MGIAKRYGPVVALEDLDLHVAQGELVTVLGPERLGQDHAAHADRRARRPVRRADRDRRPRRHLAAGGAAQRRAGVPELRAVPAHVGRRQHRLSAERARPRPAPRSSAGSRTRSGWSACRASSARQPEPALGRPAAAGRARPRVRVRARDPAPRRAARRARPQAARAAPGRAPPAAALARHHDHPGHPRPGGGALALRPDRGAGPGPGAADRDARGGLSAARQPLRRRLPRHRQPVRGRAGAERRRAGASGSSDGDVVACADPGMAPGRKAVAAIVRPERVMLAPAGSGGAASPPRSPT